jgi:hypothetical protein
MKNWKPWEHLFNEVEDKEELLNMLNLRADNPFPMPRDTEFSDRHDPSKRQGSAAIHPEDFFDEEMKPK